MTNFLAVAESNLAYLEISSVLGEMRSTEHKIFWKVVVAIWRLFPLMIKNQILKAT